MTGRTFLFLIAALSIPIGILHSTMHSRETSNSGFFVMDLEVVSVQPQVRSILHYTSSSHKSEQKPADSPWDFSRLMICDIISHLHARTIESKSFITCITVPSGVQRTSMSLRSKAG